MTLYNLARMRTDTIGTGTITVAEAVHSYLSFDRAGVQNGETITYAIEDAYDREIGRGVYNATAKTLTRNVLKSTNDDDPLDLSGLAQVAITAAAEDIREAIGSRGLEGLQGPPGDLDEAPSSGAYFRKNGVWIPMTVLYGTLTVPVPIHTAGANNFADGPTVDVGTEGTWYVTGVVAMVAGAAVAFLARLWDGTTTIADAGVLTATGTYSQSIALSGVITDPTGPLRISVAPINTAAGWFLARADGWWPQIAAPTNNNWITAVRIG